MQKSRYQATCCLPAGLSNPGSVLHVVFVELRLALPDRGLARVCAVERLEGSAGIREQKYAIKYYCVP